jgi:hypothetical protein
MPAHVSPDIRNYYIGKGKVEIMLAGDSTWRDVGNVPVFEFTPNLTKLDHYSSRNGVKKKDRVAVTEKSGTIKMQMDEFTTQNMALALMGAVGSNSAGQDEIDIFSENVVSAQVRFTGTNEIGPKWMLHFNVVDFVPASAVSPITDEWGHLEVSGETLADINGSFGKATKIADEA